MGMWAGIKEDPAGCIKEFSQHRAVISRVDKKIHWGMRRKDSTIICIFKISF